MLRIPKIRIYPFKQYFKLGNYGFSDTKIMKIIHQCYQNPSIQGRVNALKQMSDQTIQSIRIQKFTIKMPQFLRMSNAKTLNQFHFNNKTAVNLQILHSLAHIEFNAFIAYADTLFRFGLSKQYEHLWHKCAHSQRKLFLTQIKQIAKDEGQHCLMLIKRLKQLGINFGQFPVISNLTNTIYLTDKDIISRLALISIVHQGKGIKSLSRLMDKIAKCNDKDSIKILKVIESQETFHFQTGLKWFKFFCSEAFQNQQIKGQKKQTKYEYSQFLRNILNKINSQYRVNITMRDIKQGTEEKRIQQ